MSALSHFSRMTLLPGQVDSVNAQGTNFWIVFSPVPIQVMWPGGEFGIYEQGSGLDNLPNGETFPRLTVRNPSLGSITIVVYVGGPLYRDSRLSVMETRTRFASWNGTQLNATPGAGDHLDLDGVTPVAPAAGAIDLKRQSVVITNNDVLLWLEVKDAAGNVGARVLAGKQIILPVSEFLRISNPNGAAVSCCIAEIWDCALL